MRIATLAAVFIGMSLLLSPGLHGQHAPSESTGDSRTTQSPPSDGPVLLPPPSEQAVQFYYTGIALWLFRTFWGLLVPALILLTGLSARIRNTAQRIAPRAILVIAVYMVLFNALMFVVNLPLDFYSEYVRLHAYGLSNQTFAKWITDSLKSLMVLTIVCVLFLWIPYLLIRKSPRRWWLYTGLLVYPFVTFAMLVYPIWIDPLFNSFGPMQDKDLETKILAVAERAGIEGGRVYEVDKSVDTKAINAYVTGFANTKRIVLWDTAIKGLNESELLYVMAHEMGHYVLGHVVKGILFYSTLTLIGLYFIHAASGRLIRRYKHRLGFDSLSDVASFPLFLFLFGIASFVLNPVAFAYSRHNEREADRFGLELMQDNHAAANAFVKLFQQNLGYPDPHLLVKIWRHTHPSLAERVKFCNEYKPWVDGAPLRYGHLFKDAPRTSPIEGP